MEITKPHRDSIMFAYLPFRLNPQACAIADEFDGALDIGAIQAA